MPGETRIVPSSSEHNFPVVGIGASAGGLQAFKQLLKAIPADSGMAYVVVQHLNPTRESNLTEILARDTTIPIEEITNEVKVFPNHIYVVPSGKILTSVDGMLKLTPRENVKTNLVIDIFFTSLAVVWESMAVGVVLSGTGSEGTVGLKMIKDHGGITIVQDESAEYADMAQSAVNADTVDFILPPEKIPAHLLQICNTYAVVHAMGEVAELPKNDEAVIKQMLNLLQQRSGVDFTYYKQSTVRRRIGRRMALHKRDKLADYLNFLRSEKNEQDALFQDLLIPVTAFFRDPASFEILTEKVFPALFKNKPVDETTRFWIAGCSTGEEAYSIAICLHEYLANRSSPFLGVRGRIQIFASDISERAIKKARTGFYSKVALAGVSHGRLDNYFKKTSGGYQVSKAIRDLCVFAHHNFLKNPPFAKMDLISCRNVLIYMDNYLQKKAITTFHYALKENSILWLGKSETAGAAVDLFDSFDKYDKFFSRKPGTNRYMPVVTGQSEAILTTRNTEVKNEAPQADFRKRANEILLSKAPASVIVNEQLDIVHIYGNISPFLNHSPGNPSFNLLKMAGEALAFELRSAIHKVKTGGQPVTRENILTPQPGASRTLSVSVEVIPLTDLKVPHYLILFTKDDFNTNAVDAAEPTDGAELKGDATALDRNRVRVLEKELARLREDMRFITEDMQSANEEMQSANEELQSSNEEMQSLNEELETSKEEVQSSNEELIIVNQELTNKQEQLNAERNYSNAIVSTIKVPLLVLDKYLRIKTANQSFYKNFNLTETQIQGSAFYELQNNLFDNIELRTLLENILPQKSRMEDFEMLLNERTMLLNAREIINDKNTEQLILLAIEDITDTRLAKKLKISEAKFRNLIVQAPVLITTFHGPDFIIETINKTALDIWEKTYDEVINKPLFKVSPELEDGLKKILNDVYCKGQPYVNNEIAVILNRTGKPDTAYFNSVYEPLRDLDNKIYGVILIGTEVTEAVKARKLIEASENQFRNFADSIQNLAWIANGEGWIFWYNQQWYNYTGTTLQEMQGWGWEKVHHPDHIEKVIAFVTAAWKKDVAWELTFPLRRHDGAYRWFLTRAYPVKDAEGNIERWIGTNTDVTEQKNFAEALETNVKERTYQLHIQNETFKQAEESSMQGSYSFNITTGKLTYSDNLYRLLGYEPNEFEPSLEESDKYVHPDDWDNVKQVAQNILESKKADEWYYRMHTKSGKVINIKGTGRVIESGHEKLLVGTLQDVTKDVLAAEAMKEKNLALENSNTELASFSYVASHDLKEPLRKIQVFSRRIIETENFSGKTQDFFKRIISASERMQNLIDSLLKFSHINSTELVFAPCNLNTLVEEAKNDLQVRISEKEAIIEFDNLPVVMGVCVQLAQLVTNLLDNAIKYSRPDVKPVIKITAAIIEGKELEHVAANNQKKYHAIKIADNGIGFEQDYADKIFELFQRLHTKQEYSGTGIGLGIVKKIVTNHHGFIIAEGKPNIGATFTVNLPTS